MEYISAMELSTLLNKTKQSISKLTLTEHRFLSFLLARVNGKKVQTCGYLAWPGIDSIMEFTGMGDTTIQKVRKTLVAAGWMQYTSGKGPNNSNHYYINAQKIVDCCVQSGEPAPSKSAAPTVVENVVKKPHKRDTSNLRNVVALAPVIVQKLVDKPVQQSIIDPNESSFKPRYHLGQYAKCEADIRRIDYEQMQDDENCPF